MGMFLYKHCETDTLFEKLTEAVERVEITTILDGVSVVMKVAGRRHLVYVAGETLREALVAAFDELATVKR